MELKQARYWCFRFQSELEGADEAVAPDGFKERIESLPLFDKFGGWQTFGSLWDIDGDVEGNSEPFIYCRDKSLWELWDEHCASVAKAIPATNHDANIVQIVRDDFADSTEVEAILVPN
jgi:hypothetical protein